MPASMSCLWFDVLAAVWKWWLPRIKFMKALADIWEEMRWEEMSWDKVRRAQMRWRVQCEVWGKKSAVWSVECEVWSAECEVWSVECEVWTVKCEVWTVKCEVLTAKGAVWSVKCGVWSVKCEVELQMWHVKQDTSFAECTHARAWLAHGACKFYRWERSYIYISLRQLPPRLVRVLLVSQKGILIHLQRMAFWVDFSFSVLGIF